MISVCLATYNGEKYIREQLVSILQQIDEDDEVIISDDNSTDKTLDIIKSIADDRIRIYHNIKNKFEYSFDNVTHNFEAALKLSSGDYIFLSDQDDIWLPNKVSLMLAKMSDYDLVLSDCSLVDESLNLICPSYFSIVKSKVGIMKNIYKNSYLGCCMAFKRNVLNEALPFPVSGIPHDIWLGMVAECYFKVSLIKIPTLLYRRHAGNVSPSGASSTFPINVRLYLRLKLLIALCRKIIRKK